MIKEMKESLKESRKENVDSTLQNVVNLMKATNIDALEAMNIIVIGEDIQAIIIQPLQQQDNK